MTGSPFVPFYTSDFLAGTGGLTSAQRGVYITLLCMMYEAEMPLAQSYDILARRCGCTLPAFKGAISALCDDGKVVLLDAGIWSPKCDKHIKHRRERSDSAKAAAKQRWGKAQQKQRPSDAGALPTQCEPEPEPHNPPVATQQPPKGGNTSTRKRATRLAEDWTPTDKMVAYAAEKGLTPDEISRCGSDIRDWSRSSKNGTKLDWDAAWRNWIRRYADERGDAPNRQRGHGRKTNSVVAAASRSLGGDGREHGGAGNQVADVWGAGSRDAGTSPGGGDGGVRPASITGPNGQGPDGAAGGDEIAGHGRGRPDFLERVDGAGAIGIPGGRDDERDSGAGPTIDVHAEPVGNSGGVPPENGEAPPAAAGDRGGDEMTDEVPAFLRRTA